jgi:RNA polymerase sigma-70 factor (ECF subfamily)
MKSDILSTRIEKSVREDLFNEIYTLYGRKVYNLAFRMTGDAQISEDIAQETFILVYTNLDKFRGDSRISTWIYAIARNTCLRHIEKNKRKSFRSIEQLIQKVNFEITDELCDEPEKQFYINQVKDGCLLGVLRCLSFNQRMAFVLHVLFDLNIADVAKAIDKSENSTRILVHRARNNLRAFLCNNCSLYNDTNKCRCENLISFSLKQGWIEKYNPAITPKTIEAELKTLKNEIALYQTISLKKEPDDLRLKILDLAKNHDYSIFSGQKVK